MGANNKESVKVPYYWPFVRGIHQTIIAKSVNMVWRHIVIEATHNALQRPSHNGRIMESV